MSLKEMHRLATGPAVYRRKVNQAALNLSEKLIWAAMAICGNKTAGDK
jgi:hypothetical protein